jgi:hypothetical protein
MSLGLLILPYKDWPTTLWHRQGQQEGFLKQQLTKHACSPCTAALVRSASENGKGGATSEHSTQRVQLL